MKLVPSRPGALLAALIGLGSCVWLVPLLRFGPFAYGYDSGLYRRYLLEPFVSFPNTPVPGLDHTVFLPRFLLDIVRAVVHQPDIALYGSYAVLAFFGVVSVFFFARHYLGSFGGMLSGLLYALSAVQFSAEREFLFKQAAALPLFLFGILALERKRYALATLLGILIVLTHQTTSILFLVIAGAGFVLRTLFERRISLAYAFSGAFVGASYLLLHPHVADKVATPPVAVFLSQTEYFLWSMPILALALIGLQRFAPLLRKNVVLLGAFMVCISFVVLHLPFYSRVYVFLDLLLVLLAACGALRIFEWLKKKDALLAGVSMLVVLAAVAIPMIRLQALQEPSLPPDMQETLQSLGTLPVDSSIITSPALLPWAQGWSVARVYAPGIFKEPHSSQEWSLYWSHPDTTYDRIFLGSIPGPTFILARPQEAQYIAHCAKEIRLYFYSADSCL